MNDPPFEFYSAFQELLLLNTDSEQEFSELSEKFFDEQKLYDINKKQIERLVNMFPMRGNGYHLFEAISRRLISQFLKLTEKTSLSDFIQNSEETLQKIQTYCRSNNQNQLDMATNAALILVRYCSVIYIKNKDQNMKEVIEDFINGVSDGLQFLWHGTDQLLTANQRELFHMLSSHLKKLIEIQKQDEDVKLNEKVNSVLSHNLHSLSQQPPS